MKRNSCCLIATLLALTFAGAPLSLHANTYTVSNTNNSGAGSLRAALIAANGTPGNHTIAFDIPASDLNYNPIEGVWKISPQSPLPIITSNNLLLDGTTQTDSQGDTNPEGPEILLDGNYAFGSDYAFHLHNVNGVTIKGFIIGRFTIGIEISGSDCYNNTIVGNYVGCNYNATDTLPNINGIEILGAHHNIVGGNTLAARNVVSGNNHVGIRMANSNANTVSGNYVGLNRTGDAALRNYDGISLEGTSKYNLIGGYTAAERNYVSGNDAYGIPLFGTGCAYNIIVGNYAGTDITGTKAIPNTYGVLCDDGASNNRIGGYEPGAGNLLSGNSAYGVFLYNPGTQNDSIIGNRIGTDYSGSAAVPNGNGMVVDGPTFKHFIDGNTISGNTQNGIVLHLLGTDSNVIIRNKIGTDYSGLHPLGNGLDGVRLGEGPSRNRVGGAGQGNIIAYNGGNGITVMTAAETANTFSENAIYQNGGIGIDLFPEGRTPNDPGDYDDGPNTLLNYPTIESIVTDPLTDSTTISGKMDYALNSDPAGIRVELFRSDNGQGKDYLGTTWADAQGNWTFSCHCLTAGEKVTATATDWDGNTSEFYFDSTLLTAIIKFSGQENSTLFPNPAKEKITFSGLPEHFSGELHLISLRGQTVLVLPIGADTGFSCAVRSLPPGIYTAVVKSGAALFAVKRFIKE